MKRPLFPSKGLSRQAKGVRDAIIELIAESDRKWGIDRLRLLVSDDTRDKWDRQLVKFEKALLSSLAVDIRRHAEGARKGLALLEAEAIAAGHKPLDPLVWEIPLPDGTAVALVRSEADLFAVCDERETYTTAEIGKLIARIGSDIRLIKQQFAGAQISGVRPPINWETGDDISDLGT